MLKRKTINNNKENCWGTVELIRELVGLEKFATIIDLK